MQIWTLQRTFLRVNKYFSDIAGFAPMMMIGWSNPSAVGSIEAKCIMLLRLWALFVLVLPPPVRTIKLVPYDDSGDDEFDITKATCAVPSLSSKFEKACTIQEEAVDLTPLKPLQLSPARFEKTGERIAPNVYRLGLPPEVRRTLLDYCDRVGITERFRDLVVRGSPLESDTEKTERFGGFNWVVYRPENDLW